MRFKLYALILFASVSFSAQAQSIFEKWPALDQYHEVMAATFHPSEEGNLAPLKSRSGELKSKSARLAATAIPAEFNSPMILSAIKELKKENETGFVKVPGFKDKNAAFEAINKSVQMYEEKFGKNA